MLTLALEVGGDDRRTVLLALACAAVTWTPLLRACVRALTDYTVSYATSFGVLLAAALVFLPVALVASLAGTVGTTLASASGPLVVAGVLRRHVDWKDPPRL
jgi:hypothetical protein